MAVGLHTRKAPSVRKTRHRTRLRLPRWITNRAFWRRKGRRDSLSPEGWTYLVIVGAIFAGAMVRDVNLLVLLGSLLLGPLLFNWRLVAVGLKGIAVRRTLPRTMAAGGRVVVAIDLVNRRRRIGSWTVVVEDQIHAEGDADFRLDWPATAILNDLPAQSTRQAVYSVRLPQRGWYRFGPIRLSTGFPFGLVRRSVTIEQSSRLLVHPRLGWLTPRWRARQHESFEGSHRLERRRNSAGSDLYGTREWRNGDSRRWIHWRSSAKHGSLVVRQFEQNRNRDLALLLDLWQPAEPTVEDRENVELAVSFTATVIADACRTGGSSLLVVTGGAAVESFAGSASSALMQQALERLAVVRASPAERLPELLVAAAEKIEAGTEVVLVTTRPLKMSDTQYLPALRRQSRGAHVGRIRILRTCDAALSDYFQVE
jgi:uncharacterized protein (DUF58 family)